MLYKVKKKRKIINAIIANAVIIFFLFVFLSGVIILFYQSKTEQNNKPTTGGDLLKRTDLTPEEVKQLLKLPNDKEGFFKRAANEIKYSGYIAKQQREVENSKKNEKVMIPSDTNYTDIKGLSNEVIEKLNKHQPSTLGQASRLEGVTPAATNLIAITIKKKQLLEKA